jgi:hypothetical protein
MRLIRHADLQPLPWKNEGGITREVAIFPPGADMNGFLWRVSTASVASDSPFSVFPGVDRPRGRGHRAASSGSARRWARMTAWSRTTAAGRRSG